MSDWSTLKQRCEDNRASLILRAETFDGQYRFSLAAVDRDGKIIFDLRANDDGQEPQAVIIALVLAALERWWA